jgi:hypothetical protein
VATTATLGASAVAAGLAPGTGLVTGLPEFAAAGLPGLDELVIGGHDVVSTPVPKRAEALAEAGVVPLALVDALSGELEAVDGRVRQLTGHRSESDLIKMRAREGMKVARAKGRLRGKQPKLSSRQEAHIVALHAAGGHTISELEELFSITRSTVYRALARDRTRAAT